MHHTMHVLDAPGLKSHTVLNLGPDCSIKSADVVRDLGVLLDNTLSLKQWRFYIGSKSRNKKDLAPQIPRAVHNFFRWSGNTDWVNRQCRSYVWGKWGN